MSRQPLAWAMVARAGSPVEVVAIDEHVATIRFIDGVSRPVYEGDDGRQYVINGDGQKVYGGWFFPRGEPRPTVIVNAAPR